MKYKSFIDVLFILLFGAIVMLAHSGRLGELDTAPARVGAGGVSPIRADQIRIVAVGEADLALDGDSFTDAQALAFRLGPEDSLVLVPADERVSHHRVMAVWSAFRDLGREASLGVEPADPEARLASNRPETGKE